LVQLQDSKKELQAAKIQVVAISYDDVDKLSRFAQKADIQFPLLSDSDSKTIDAWGVRNKDMQGKRIDGVPHPGTFIVGTDGKVAAKLFYEGYQKRHVAEDIIEAAKRTIKKRKAE
jgi:peroxiredoxin Q/BCP